MGSSSLRSIVRTSAYDASGSAERGRKSFSLPCDFKKRRVISSLGKTELVAPVSAPILVIVARSGTDRVATPGPPYSNSFPTPPFTETRWSSVRIMSLAVTHGESVPSNSTRTTSGEVRRKGCPAMAMATSRPPAPIASIPRPPPVDVWLSEPSSVSPGTPNRSR